MSSYGGDNRGPLLNVVCWIFNSLGLGVVALRLVSHLKIAKTSGIDDVFVTVAVLANLARAILVSVAIGEGYGRHIYTLEPPSIIPKILRLAVILQAIGVWTWALPKLAVVALLQRVFVPPLRTLILLYGSAIILLIFSLILTIVTFEQCTPLEYNWNRMLPGGSCWNPNINLGLGYFAGAYSILLDVVYALYPVLTVSKLQMSLQKKIVVCASLALGIPAAITTIVKQTLVKELVETTDITWATTPLEVWNSIEGNLLVIAASLPLIKPVLRSANEHWSGLSSRLFTSKATGLSSSSKKKSEPTPGNSQPTYPSSGDDRAPYPRRDPWQHLSDDEDGIELIEYPRGSYKDVSIAK